MHKAPIVALAMALSLMGTTVHSQAPPATTPQQDLAQVSPKLNLTLEQRHTIREIIKDKTDAAPADVAAVVGEPVPQGAVPRPMPTDVARKVPQVRAHSYFLTAQQIVIVDPKDNRVADVIERAED
jgi:adenosylmethionine-8-amino-7-oxononanoate aminotransferase